MSEQDGAFWALAGVSLLVAAEVMLDKGPDDDFGSMSRHSEAQRISDKYDDDGSNWYTEDGDSIQEDLHQLAYHIWRRDDSLALFIFGDGSMISAGDDWWSPVTIKDRQLVDENGETVARVNADGDPIGWTLSN
tara:strand:- start:2076 stop:2477 length:402 start_codon:yes stop_codon:yes gene_type:complete